MAAGGINARAAVSRWRVKERFKGYTLLEVSPETGRTHQIRVHLNSIHHPIIGDVIYGKKVIDGMENSRLFLHAFRLNFISPSGQNLLFECDLPSELSSILEALEKK